MALESCKKIFSLLSCQERIDNERERASESGELKSVVSLLLFLQMNNDNSERTIQF